MSDLQLVIVSGPNEGTEFEITGAAVIGRDPSSGIVLDDPESSRRHASVTATGDTVTVEDLGSTNGVFVAGERISGSREVPSGTRIRIGTTVLEVRYESEAAAAAPETPADTGATRIASVPSVEEPAAAPEPPPVPEPPAPEPVEPPAAYEPPAPPEPEPEPADSGTLSPEPTSSGDAPGTLAPEPTASDAGATELRPIPDASAEPPSDAGATELRPIPDASAEPPSDAGATELRPIPDASGEPPADEGATALRSVPSFDQPGDATQAPPPGGGPAVPPPPPLDHGPPPPPPPPGAYAGDPGTPPPPPAFGGGPPPPPPGGGFGGPEGAPPPPPGYAGPGAPPPQPPGYAGGPMVPAAGFAPQGPMPPRNSVVEWLLSYFVPFYNLYWFHRSNKEMQAWSNGRIDYNATSSLLALTLGSLVIVPVFIAWSSYIGRVREAQRMAGLPQDVTFWGSVGRAILLLYSVKWLQDKFNEIGTRPPQY